MRGDEVPGVRRGPEKFSRVYELLGSRQKHGSESEF
jgi:hypothetical protein